MKKIDQDPFSNGTEFDVWDAHNCERCIKNSHLKDNEIDYTKVVVIVFSDTRTDMYGDFYFSCLGKLLYKLFPSWTARMYFEKGWF